MDINNKKILITTGGGLGDMIVYTPALRRLKEKYPQCKVTFMTKYGNHEILKGLAYIDKLIYIKRGKFMGRYRVLPDFYKQDAVVFTDWQPQLLLFSRIFNVPIRAGIPRWEKHRLNDFLTYHIKAGVYKTNQYVARTHADMIEESLGIKLDGAMDKLDVAVPSDKDRAFIDDALKKINVNKEYMVLSPFASMEQRDWPIERAREFIEYAEKKYKIPVVITGPSSKMIQSRQISLKYNLTGHTNTMQLVELIKRASILVTPDSGPMHIAGAVGTKCIALFSKDLPQRWAPKHNCTSIYLNAKCSPCDDETARCCKYGVYCMRNISAEMVLDKIDI